MAKYKVRLVDLVTGEVRNMDVEASSKEEAVGMFDSSKFEVSIPSAEDKPGSRVLWHIDAPDWVAGPGGVDITEGSLFYLVGLPVIVFVGIFLLYKMSIDGTHLPSPIFVLFGGIGMFCFLVVYYLAKIANKK